MSPPKIWAQNKAKSLHDYLIGKNRNSFSKEGLLWTVFYQKGVVPRFENFTSKPFKTFKKLNFCVECKISVSK